MSKSVVTVEFDPELLQGYWVQIPKALLRSPRLSCDAKSLYGVLLTFTDEKEWPRQSVLCECLGVSENTLRRALRELIAMGLVEMQHGGDGKVSSYTVRSVKSMRQTGGKEAETTPAKTSRTAKSEVLKDEQNRKICAPEPFRTAKSEGPPYIETSLEAAATHMRTPARETQPAQVPKSAAAADASVSRIAPESEAPPSLPLSEMTQADVATLATRDPGDLVRRFNREHGGSGIDGYGDRIARKRATAKTSPNVLLARCIVEDWLPEIREKRHAAASRSPVAKVDAAVSSQIHAAFTPRKPLCSMPSTLPGGVLA